MGESDTPITEEKTTMAPNTDQQDPSTLSKSSILKLSLSVILVVSAFRTYNNSKTDLDSTIAHLVEPSQRRRRLSSKTDGDLPTYMKDLMNDLKERKKLFEETPPEEVKYWFEYAGPLQKYYYRWSKSRGKADSFEGRDDSGVVSSRFVDTLGGGEEFAQFFSDESYPEEEVNARSRLVDNCLSMGSPVRPDVEGGTLWQDWFGKKKDGEDVENGEAAAAMDRCRILVVLNTVGAGRGPTMLWETQPPKMHAQGPKPFVSEQETAATHLERNLKEIDAMCASGQVAARVQVLVCEPIPGEWTDWMDSLLVNCGGKPLPVPGDQETEEGAKKKTQNPYDKGIEVEERPSPVQVVVVASATTADTCHDLKSGFMEKRMQDLVLAPPHLSASEKEKDSSKDPSIKTTHPDLISSDDHDLYVAIKWSSLVTLRSVSSFLQASADIAAAAASPNNQSPTTPEKTTDGVTVSLNSSPSSPFLVPSFVRVSYVSEENNKVAKWRMHGDFFHPAAWEICKDSFDVTWIPDSLSGSGGVNGICYSTDNADSPPTHIPQDLKQDCGQWWGFMAEEQMPTTPEVYANENTPPLVQGGSNYVWMITERQRVQIVKQHVCERVYKNDLSKNQRCGQKPQAVLPLGDLESFQINFTPNTALGKKHNVDRTPGYSKQDQRAKDRETVRERKQLKGQDDIEKALFEYTVYASALFRKDATIKASRARDAVLTKVADTAEEDVVGPQTVKSSYYDVTITKPRPPVLGWCQALARKGLCTLYAEYFREGDDDRCREACGMRKDWTAIQSAAASEL